MKIRSVSFENVSLYFYESLNLQESLSTCSRAKRSLIALNFSVFVDLRYD